jgi:carbonic anhydrase
MRSILLAIYELKANEVAVVGHSGCGMTGLSCERIIDKARLRGVSNDVLDTLSHAGINLKQWQPVEGGFYYRSVDGKAHFLKGSATEDTK